MLDPEKAKRLIGCGIGQITRLAGATNLEAREVAVLANEVQRFLVEKTRLGIPGNLPRGVPARPPLPGCPVLRAA